MSEAERKSVLVYAHFGDTRAISAVSAIHCQLKARNMSLNMEAKTISALPSAWWWSGQAVVNGRKYPLDIAVIHERDDNDERLGNLGLERTNCLRLVGNKSTHRRQDGLIHLYAGVRNEGHLRDFERYRLKEWGRLLTVQVIQSFVANRFLRKPRPARRTVTTSRLLREAEPSLVETPSVAAVG